MDYSSPEEANCIVAGAARAVVITGAGVSTGSGIPDYRGPNGVWTKDPMAEKLSDVSYYLESEEVREAAWARLCSLSALSPEPSAGHVCLVNFGATGNMECLITQNIDGLHREAGTSLSKLVELHGDTRQVKCFRCGNKVRAALVIERVRAGEVDPKCLVERGGVVCGGIMGTNIVRFGEFVPGAVASRARRAVDNCDLLVCVGSTLLVSTVSGLVDTVLYDGKDMIIVNNSPTQYDHSARAVVRGDIGDVLGRVLGVG